MAKEATIILGAGGQGRVAAAICRAAEIPVHGFLDDTIPPGERVDGVPVLGGFALIEQADLREACAFHVSVGECAARRQWCEAIVEKEGRLAEIRHPSAYVAESARLGAGVFLNVSVAVFPGAEVGAYGIVNNHSSIGHDSTVGSAVLIGPGVHLAGNFRCGDECLLGAGTTAQPRVQIGDRVKAAAGTALAGSFGSDLILAGSPARAIPGTLWKGHP